MQNLEFEQRHMEPSAVFAMREIRPDDVQAAHAKLAKSSDVTVWHQDEAGMFDRYIVHSKTSVYEVFRLGYFASCTCPNFEKGHRICKHIAATLEQVCTVCLTARVRRRGAKCDQCFHLTEGFMYSKAA